MGQDYHLANQILFVPRAVLCTRSGARSLEFRIEYAQLLFLLRLAITIMLASIQVVASATTSSLLKMPGSAGSCSGCVRLSLDQRRGVR